MHWDIGRVARICASTIVSIRSLDWGLFALISGFVLIVPIGAGLARADAPLFWLSRLFSADPFVAYEDALAAAALKRPSYRMKLAMIDGEKAKVVSFRTPRPLPLQARTFDMWVALADEVREACRGAADPVLKLQQVLGLPQTAAPGNVVTEIEVPRAGLFRPCIGENGIDKPMCEFELANPPANDADASTLREAYDRMRFGTKQMWEVYRSGFHRATRSPTDYPYSGYPFTGMGWTYNWADPSRGHFGVSEFVVKRDAVIEIVSEKPPGEFCGKPG
jgi:hypothetical protein